jgi:uncharacterized glyoxalase superfamily protein PhnB
MISGLRERTQNPAVLGFNTQTITVIVADVDAHYAKTRQQGATIWEELHETIYGERQYGVEDLEGHRWLFAEHVRDVSPEKWGATITTPLS